MTQSADPLLLMGALLVREGVLSEESLEAAILNQVGHRALRWPGKRLGDHLVVSNALLRNTLEKLLAPRDAAPVSVDDTVLGEIAVRNGLLKPEELSVCLAEQERARAAGETPLRLGKLILEKKFMGEQELQALLDRQQALLEASRRQEAADQVPQDEYAEASGEAENALKTA